MSVVCFVSYEIHPTTVGGCGVLIHHAADRLLRAGHGVVLLLDVSADIFATFLREHRATLPNHDRLRAYRVADLCADAPCSPGSIPCVFQLKSLRFAHALRKVVREERPDYVEFFDYCGPGYYACVERLYRPEPGPVLGTRAHGTIEVLDRHGEGLVKDRDQFILHSMERAALAISQAVLVPSRAYYERYYRSLYHLEESRVEVSSPPKQPFPRVTKRPDGNAFSIVSIGRMFHLKGVDQLVHASVMLMKQRPTLNFRVDLVGYDCRDGPLGSYTRFLRTMIPEHLRDRFVFTGHLSHEEIARRLDDALFAVFPNRIESFCYALHEAYDAGVPIIANNLPAFTDFFRHERNALIYDGTTRGLLAAMERMIDEPQRREALRRPYPVAEEPLGGFYDRPQELAAEASTDRPRVLAVVLVDSRGDLDGPALGALRAQTDKEFRTLVLVAEEPDHEETLWWLGRSWHVRDPDGATLEPSDLATLDAMVIFDARDRIEPDWIELAKGALSRRAGMAFAGTWLKEGGRLIPGTLDVAPELYPFEGGAALPRVLVRTRPGVPLTDVLDTSLGELGFLGLVWDAIARHGRGCLLPEGKVEVADSPTSADPAAVKALVLRFGAPFAERLAQLAPILWRQGGQPASATEPVEFTVETKMQIADELGGRTLARMAWDKLVKRATGRAEKRL